MTVLPEPKPTAPAAGQTANPLTDAVIKAAVDNAIHESRRDSTSPPETRASRPPMSQKAVDASGIMLAGSVASVPLGGMTCLVLYTLDQVDPLSLTIGACAPVALVLAIGVLLKRAKGVLPDEIHNHYDGATVIQDQRETHTSTRGVWAKTNNQLPK